MPATIPNDWPDEVKLEAVTPLVYLKTQAVNLQDMTRGALVAVVRTTTDEHDSRAAHSLELVAPALEHARKVVLVASHDIGNPYPVVIDAEGLNEPVTFRDGRRTASNYAEFRDIVKTVLRSKGTLGAIHSFLARINEKQMAPPESP